MAILIGAYRNILVEGRWPDLTALAGLTMTTAVLLWLGLGLFTRARFDFAEET
jgi:ABC-type polysaccharide/polyol phosphate export permease